jgi:hypothetical protein
MTRDAAGLRSRVNTAAVMAGTPGGWIEAWRTDEEDAVHPGRYRVHGRQPMPSRARTWAIGVGLAISMVAMVRPVLAQEDFRSLDAGRPIRITDAYPVRYLEWEVQLGVRGTLAETGRGAAGSFELETGLFRNTELGIGFEPAFSRVSGRSSTGIESFSSHALYNFNQESWSWPAFSVRLDVDAPGGGSLGREAWRYEATAIATRTFASRARIHANAGYAAAGLVDGGDSWVGGIALDAPLGLFSRLLAGDVYVEVPVDRGRTRVLAEIGTRLQLSNLSVLDIGLGGRLDEWADGRSNVQLVIGLSRVFGFPGFVRPPRYPNPRID